jgi:hypothetical protein
MHFAGSACGEMDHDFGTSPLSWEQVRNAPSFFVKSQDVTRGPDWESFAEHCTPCYLVVSVWYRLVCRASASAAPNHMQVFKTLEQTDRD